METWLEFFVMLGLVLVVYGLGVIDRSIRINTKMLEKVYHELKRPEY